MRKPVAAAGCRQSPRAMLAVATPAGRSPVVDHVLRRTMWIDPNAVQVHVAAGVATLTGAVGRRTTAAIAARLTGEVPGVLAVADEVRYAFDDTTLARSRSHRIHPFSAEPFNR